MTTELTDTELRVKCAEAMGYDTKQYQTGGVLHYRDKQGRMMAALPNYPSDPAAALTLVDKLGADGWSFKLDKQINGPWLIMLDLDVPKFSSRTVTASGDTFCRAICRAFLAVKGKDI